MHTDDETFKITGPDRCWMNFFSPWPGPCPSSRSFLGLVRWAYVRPCPLAFAFLTRRERSLDFVRRYFFVCLFALRRGLPSCGTLSTFSRPSKLDAGNGMGAVISISMDANWRGSTLAWPHSPPVGVCGCAGPALRQIASGPALKDSSLDLE